MERRRGLPWKRKSRRDGLISKVLNRSEHWWNRRTQPIPVKKEKQTGKGGVKGQWKLYTKTYLELPHDYGVCCFFVTKETKRIHLEETHRYPVGILYRRISAQFTIPKSRGEKRNGCKCRGSSRQAVNERLVRGRDSNDCTRADGREKRKTDHPCKVYQSLFGDQTRLFPPTLLLNVEDGKKPMRPFSLSHPNPLMGNIN